LANSVPRACAILLATLALCLAGCSKPEPEAERHEAAVPAVAPAIQPPPRQVVRTSWTFSADKDECVAVAAAGGTALRVTVRRSAPIRLALSLAPPLEVRAFGRAAIPLRFTGPTGRWQVVAQQSGIRQLAVALGSDETALSRVLVLLSGGMLEVGEPGQANITLAVAPSDTRGQLWFDCARGKII
jgi:hypothetical protein